MNKPEVLIVCFLQRIVPECCLFDDVVASLYSLIFYLNVVCFYDVISSMYSLMYVFIEWFYRFVISVEWTCVLVCVEM